VSQDPGGPTAAGQISADRQFRWDGQQWVPLAPGFREPTPWTRPMQMITAALFVLSALSSIISTAIFVNHDSVLRAIKAQGTQIPSGIDIDTVVGFSIGVTWAIVIFFAVLEVGAAIGSYLGWRWIFWVALVLFGLSGISALTNIGSLTHPDRSPIPIGGVIASEVFAICGLAIFIWMLVGVIKYGPWAMKKPAP
jgi:hypothetical protein